MAGIGDGFTQGLAIGGQWRERKKDREMDRARIELEAKRHGEERAARKQLQDEVLAKRAEEAGLDRQLRMSMAEKDAQRYGDDQNRRKAESDRNYGLSERELALREKQAVTRKSGPFTSMVETAQDYNTAELEVQKRLRAAAMANDNAGATNYLNLATTLKKNSPFETRPEQEPIAEVEDATDPDRKIKYKTRLSQVTKKSPEEEEQALAWAQANPDDPRAQAILEEFQKRIQR